MDFLSTFIISLGENFMTKRFYLILCYFIIGYFIYSQDLNFFTKNDEYDAWRIPLIYPYELWCTNDKYLINWTYNGEIGFGVSGYTQKICIKNQYIILFVDQHEDPFDENITIPQKYYIIDTNKEGKRSKRVFDKIENLNTALKQIGIDDCKLESIKDIFEEYMKTGICYWFPDDIKKKILEERKKK
jgi:hypothetical protein